MNKTDSPEICNGICIKPVHKHWILQEQKVNLQDHFIFLMTLNRSLKVKKKKKKENSINTVAKRIMCAAVLWLKLSHQKEIPLMLDGSLFTAQLPKHWLSPPGSEPQQQRKAPHSPVPQPFKKPPVSQGATNLLLTGHKTGLVLQPSIHTQTPPNKWTSLNSPFCQ